VANPVHGYLSSLISSQALLTTFSACSNLGFTLLSAIIMSVTGEQQAYDAKMAVDVDIQAFKTTLIRA
jgi:hypothetical protein